MNELEALIDAKGAELADWFLKLRAEGKSPEYCGKFMALIINGVVVRAQPELRDLLRDKLTAAMHEHVQLTKCNE